MKFRKGSVYLWKSSYTSRTIIFIVKKGNDKGWVRGDTLYDNLYINCHPVNFIRTPKLCKETEKITMRNARDFLMVENL